MPYIATDPSIGLIACISEPIKQLGGVNVVSSQVPSLPDNTFSNETWSLSEGAITVDLPKAKLEAHAKRRAKRDADMLPHDTIIAKQIPSQGKSPSQVFDEEEAKREVIRVADAEVQVEIDGMDLNSLYTYMGRPREEEV